MHNVSLLPANKHVYGIIFVFFVVHLIRVGGGEQADWCTMVVSVGQSQNSFYSLVDTKDEGRLTGCWLGWGVI